MSALGYYGANASGFFLAAALTAVYRRWVKAEGEAEA
jgi:hypothetical protein